MNKPNKPKTHLFSSHTGQCSYFGKSAEHAAIENTPCGSVQTEPCEACGDQGWLLADNSDHGLRIERCDACQMFENDQAALHAVVSAAESQPALLKFVEEVAGLKHEEEPGDDGAPFEPTSEDLVATHNPLLLEARQLRGAADKCEKCQETVPYVIGCQDGTELSQDCFGAGQD